MFTRTVRWLRWTVSVEHINVMQSNIFHRLKQLSRALTSLPRRPWNFSLRLKINTTLPTLVSVSNVPLCTGFMLLMLSSFVDSVCVEVRLSSSIFCLHVFSLSWCCFFCFFLLTVLWRWKHTAQMEAGCEVANSGAGLFTGPTSLCVLWIRAGVTPAPPE